MKVLVCGGRKYSDVDKVCDTLYEIHRNTPITLLIHGAARGADSIADWWARFTDNNVLIKACPADWGQYGLRAGYVRNTYMASLKPDLVVAFPGGKGTANMVDIAKKAGIPVREIQ